MYSVVLVLLEYRMCSYDFHTEKKNDSHCHLSVVSELFVCLIQTIDLLSLSPSGGVSALG